MQNCVHDPNLLPKSVYSRNAYINQIYILVFYNVCQKRDRQFFFVGRMKSFKSFVIKKIVMSYDSLRKFTFTVALQG